MKTEIKDIEKRNLDYIPESCRGCLYWEFPEEFEKATSEKRIELEKKKKEWFLQTLKTFGNCGKIIYFNDVPVGYAQYAPSTHLPQSSKYESGPVGRLEEGVVFLSCLYIADKNMRGKGLGEKLLEAVVADLNKRGFKAVETFARRGSSNNPSGPVEFYTERGFYIKDEANQEFPLVRLDLQR